MINPATGHFYEVPDLNWDAPKSRSEIHELLISISKNNYCCSPKARIFWSKLKS